MRLPEVPSMGETKHRVAIVGCGSMGQLYADAYSTYPKW